VSFALVSLWVQHAAGLRWWFTLVCLNKPHAVVPGNAVPMPGAVHIFFYGLTWTNSMMSKVSILPMSRNVATEAPPVHMVTQAISISTLCPACSAEIPSDICCQSMLMIVRHFGYRLHP